MNEELLGHLKNLDTWKRVALMVLFIIIAQVVELVIAVVVLFQVILTVVTGSQNAPVRQFGGQLAQYLYQIVRYLVFNTDQTPFPFADWPDADEPAPVVASEPPITPAPAPEPEPAPESSAQPDSTDPGRPDHY